MQGKRQAWGMTRLEFLRKKRRPIPKVPQGPGDYLLTALMEVGPVEYGGMGEMRSISWQTLYAYARATQAIDQPWEFRALAEMSRAYIEGIREGEAPSSIPPVER